MKNALVVVDMQNDFINGSLGTKEAEAIVPAVVREIESGKYDTIFVTRDTHGTDYMDTNEGRHLPVPHCIKDTEGWQINTEIRKALLGKDAVYIDKPTFGSERLVEILKRNNPDTVTFVGLCTDICVVSNALMTKAALYEKDICLAEDATAGVTPEAKAAAVATMRSCQIEII